MPHTGRSKLDNTHNFVLHGHKQIQNTHTYTKCPCSLKGNINFHSNFSKIASFMCMATLICFLQNGRLMTHNSSNVVQPLITSACNITLSRDPNHLRPGN